MPRVVWVLGIGSFINRFGGFVLVFLVLDQLIHDRQRTQLLFGFQCRTEI